MGRAHPRGAMPFQLTELGTLRLLAWLALLGLGVWTLARRPDAAGRAFAFWALVWAGGIQALLTLQSMATDAATQQLLYRADYYAILLASPSFLALLLYAPRRVARANLGLALLLAPALLLALWFATDKARFITETVQGGAYAAPNAGFMQVLYHVVLWSGFSVGMLWLGWKAPSLEPRARASATWLMAGLALFAADRLARTVTWWLRDPTTLPGGVEGAIYTVYTIPVYAVGIAWMVLRDQRVPGGANVGLAALLGLAVGATSLGTFGMAGLGTGIGVLLSALLAPLYGALLAQGVLEAPSDAVVPAKRDRAAVLSEA